jgi:hypothetical protein
MFSSGTVEDLKNVIDSTQHEQIKKESQEHTKSDVVKSKPWWLWRRGGQPEVQNKAFFQKVKENPSSQQKALNPRSISTCIQNIHIETDLFFIFRSITRKAIEYTRQRARAQMNFDIIRLDIRFDLNIHLIIV